MYTVRAKPARTPTKAPVRTQMSVSPYILCCPPTPRPCSCLGEDQGEMDRSLKKI